MKHTTITQLWRIETAFPLGTPDVDIVAAAAAVECLEGVDVRIYQCPPHVGISATTPSEVAARITAATLEALSERWTVEAPKRSLRRALNSLDPYTDPEPPR